MPIDDAREWYTQLRTRKQDKERRAAARSIASAVLQYMGLMERLNAR